MKTYKRIIALLVALVVAFSMTACGAKEAAPAEKPAEVSADTPEKTPEKTPEEAPAAEPVTITVAGWANDAEYQNYMYMLEGIEEEYPEIKVEFLHYPSSEEFWAAVPVALAAGNGPDIIAFSDEGNAEYMATGTIMPLDDLMEKVDFDKEKFVSSLWGGWTFNDEIYGVPYDTSTSMFIINKDFMDEAGLTETPKTMEELFDFAQAMTTDDHAGICLNIMEFHLTQYCHAFGGDWGNGKTINTPENAAGLQYFVDLYKTGAAKTPQEVGATWDGEAFTSGKCAMSTGGPWYVGTIKEAAPDMNYVAVPIPTGTVAAQSAYSHGLAITTQSKNPEAAMKVIKHMTRDEAQVNGIAQVGYAPAVEALLPQYVESVPNCKVIFDNLPTDGMPFSYPVKTAEFNAELVRGIETIIYDEGAGLTVESLLEELQAKYGA